MTSPNEKNLRMYHATTKILSSILSGVADATLKCMDYPGCIKGQGQQAQQGQVQAQVQAQTGGLGLTDIGTFGANVIDYVETTIILIIKIIAVFTDTIAPVLEEAIFGDLANKPWDEIAPKITRILNEKKDYYDKMSRDPEIQQALKQWAEAYATIGIQTTEAIRPSINMMIDEAMEMLFSAGSRASRGVINTTLNLTEAAIGEIPVAGGIIDLVLAIIRGVNNGLLAAAPPIKFGLEAAGTGYNTAKKVIGIVNEGKQRIEDATQSIQKLTDKFKNIGTIGDMTINNVTNIGKQLGKNVIESAQTAALGAVQGAVQGVTDKVEGAVQGVTDKVQGAADKVEGAVQGAVQDAANASIDTALENRLAMLKAPNVPTTELVASKTPTMVGGARKQIKHKINKTTQRIKKTLYNFRHNSMGKKTKRRRRRL
jgi:hypothetical protein